MNNLLMLESNMKGSFFGISSVDHFLVCAVKDITDVWSAIGTQENTT